MRYSATFILGTAQYTPNRRRPDGKGYESDWLEADDFEKAAIEAKRRFLERGDDKNLTATAILIIAQSDDGRLHGFRQFSFATLKSIP